MNHISLPKPHGYLIWRGKQKAIASPTLLPASEKLLLVSNDEAYGEIVLSSPAKVNIAELEKHEVGYHCLRPETRKLLWPEAESFFIYEFKEWQPFETARMVEVNNGSVEFIEERKLSDAQKQLLERAGRLPKIIVLEEDAVVWQGDKAVIKDGLSDVVSPFLDVVLEDATSDDLALPLYQLALVRAPKFRLEKKSREALKAMPYKTQSNHPDCDEDKPIGLVNKQTGKLAGCHEDNDAAMAQARAIMAKEEDKGKASSSIARLSKKELAEGEKCENMVMPMMGGATSFADMMAMEEMQEQMMETNKLTSHFSMLASNIMASPEISDKGVALKALAEEYARLVGEAMAEKALNAEDTPGSKGDEEIPEDAKAGRRMRQSMMDKLKSAWATIKELMDWADEPMMEEEDMPMGMAGFGKGYSIAVKTINGEPWFISYSTNAFKDREKEIFSTESLEKYVNQAEKSGDRGFFNLWHIPGTDFARKEWQAVIGRFLVEAGPFLENEQGQKALAFFSEYPDGHPDIAPEGYGGSPEYRYLPEERKSGVYENIWITRTSTLPRLAAANLWTKGGITMALSEQQKQAANKIFGEALAAQIIKGAEDATKELEEAGIAHKGEAETGNASGESVTATQAAGLTIEALKAELEPFAEAMSVIGEQMAKLQAKQDELDGQVKSLKKTEEIKANTETPRATLFSFQRASEAQKTVVAEDDALKNNKPAETQKQDKSGAAAFFPAR